VNTEPAPDEPILKRHGRAIVLIALAAVVMGAAGTAYWRANVTSLIEPAASTARVAQSPISYPLAIPTQRSTGLVRGGAVSMLIQEYGGLNNQNPLGLIASVQTSDPDAIRLLTNELNVLPVFPSDVRFCPMDDGSYFAIVLTYADGVTTPVKVEPTGCRAVSVGGSNPIVLWAFDSPELFNTLRSLLAGHRVG
jgi:hypothetical protein